MSGSNAARPALEALAAAALAWAVCPGDCRATAIGLGSAWAASSVSMAWLMSVRDRPMQAFWRAFGGGMALRAATLVVLAVWAARHPRYSQPALLLSYAFGVLGLLLLEYRHLRFKT